MGKVKVWTDGSCSPNPGKGGWAWVTEDGRQESGSASPSTNQRMELTAAIQAIRAHAGKDVVVISDSQYVVKGATAWMPRWKRNGWKRGNSDVKNLDLWKALDEATALANVAFKWVRGHSGDRMNERADALAQAAVSRRFVA